MNDMYSLIIGAAAAVLIFLIGPAAVWRIMQSVAWVVLVILVLI